MATYHIDLETRSDADLTQVGAYAYAEHPSTRILMCAVSRNDLPPLLWIHPDYDVLRQSNPAAERWLEAAFDHSTHSSPSTIYAHNVQFEWAMLKARAAIDMPFVREPKQRNQRLNWDEIISPRLRCTAAMARKAGLPASLEKACAITGGAQKDKKGAALIRLFSIQGANPDQHRDKWLAFCHYCIQDVVAEKELHQALKQFELQGDDLSAFQFDMRMNALGIPVDIEALSRARSLVEKVITPLKQRFYELTGVEVTQREKVCGVFGLPDLKPDTLEAYQTPKDKALVEAFEILKDTRSTSLSKIDTMINAACEDGRVRGCFIWHGANTGRWSGSLIQPQNFKKPTGGLPIDHIMRDIRGGMDAKMIDLLHGFPLDIIASVMRGFIRSPKYALLDGDYNAIECRVLNWLAGQDDIVAKFRKGEDLYMHMAKLISPTATRKLGKVCELGCGYGMGAEKFFDTAAAWGSPIDPSLSQPSVTAYRQSHPLVVKLWSLTQGAAIKALQTRQPQRVNDKFSFRTGTVGKIKYLFMVLPSGREIAYPFAAIGQGRYGPEVQYKTMTAKGWQTTGTYGGKLVENACQGVAYDLMANGAIEAEAEGFAAFMLVHDQGLCEANDTLLTPSAFAEALCRAPEWAAGLPLKVEAEAAASYR